MRIAHAGLRRLFERGDSRRLNPAHVRRIRRVRADLAVASSLTDLDQPGYRLHPLKGDRRGLWSVRVSGNWRIVFCFADGEAVDVDLIDYHSRGNIHAYVRPTTSGEMIRDILEDEEVTWSVTECAQRLDVARNTLSRLLNGRLGISPRMALALERIAWSNADHWMRLQAAYDLAQERRKQAAA